MFDATPISVDYNKMPKCVYTQPEVASIGQTKELANEEGFKTKHLKFHLRQLEKQLLKIQKFEWFCEIVIDQENDNVLGINMIGPT